MSSAVGRSVPVVAVLMEGIVFGDSPRSREGPLWVSDWGAGRVFSVAYGSAPPVEAEVSSFPMCIDLLPDGDSWSSRRLTAGCCGASPDRSLVTHADLAPGLDQAVERHRGRWTRQRLCPTALGSPSRAASSPRASSCS